eukprot:1145148-Pelagomonas_calceolata.AAC.1
MYPPAAPLTPTLSPTPTCAPTHPPALPILCYVKEGYHGRHGMALHRHAPHAHKVAPLVAVDGSCAVARQRHPA